ncbi:hypothetical protein H112_00810 [Trichophyton rubrum D6]|uniref:V-type proton ATPase subunit C n=4 Tax=Trichophyton TaxID=5550 RepID=F2SZE9_TRIRC|nr:uncharacterized protein TERG_07920 [Trichophyton rubrum CBS 118892]EZF27164.1 hypothetical protein H100_00808 [Trichophyton rubrum MR850]EZF46087.1 hypothetical protein H102_00800 [Trichophyton rubrum CBS 100081]EZF56847.1 hypothetical protein H103_00808 [Trichophyton rubrum CBS 288.86]EZF67532.1 hypothetical protein H104_00792 [Trichophyton rubrum CBS 289.86]EZF78195.1 hypothetical protein H105_00803 [Trichophyton soudanense CBS 452.61]EZF88852.1 hypothetical protein H110_00808 [Trichophy
MSKQARYILLSLPNSISPSHHRDDALEAIRSIVADNGNTAPFTVPEFKIGTLDALVQQADELGKVEALCENVVSKVGDVLSNVLEGDEAQISRMKMVNERPLDQYLQSFSWNKVKYRADKSLAELIDLLQKEINSIDNDVRAKFTQYNSVKSNLAGLQRKQTGNLSTKSLASVVDPSLLVQDSEYLETHLIALPSRDVKDFLRAYETLSPMVVPRSSILLASDDEYTLYGVTTFKKHSAEFIHKCRENRWTPREYKYVEDGGEEERKEIDQVAGDAKRLWGEALRLGKTGWGEAVMVWVHILALRMFVETVLRYGLPLDFTSVLIKSTGKNVKKIKDALDSSYSYLGGNAFTRDKKGRVRKDDPNEMQQVGVPDTAAEYTAFVYYEFEVE